MTLGGRQKRTTLLAITAASVLFCVALAVPVNAWLQFQHSYKAFPTRHLEITEFINEVYRYSRHAGRFPDAVAADRLSPLPAEWKYLEKTDPSDPNSTPLVCLYGPYHMSLVYYFSPPDARKISGEWIMSVEGDKTPFEADVIYRRDSRPTNRGVQE